MSRMAAVPVFEIHFHLNFCFTVYAAFQCNVHSTYPTHLMSKIISDGQYKYDELHYPFLTPPVRYVFLDPKNSLQEHHFLSH